VPIFDLMRNNGTTEQPLCVILVFYLNSNLPSGQSFVLGNAFF